MKPITLEDRVVIVTGAGSGLGAEYARQMAARGGAIVVNDIDGAAAESIVAEITTAGGRAAAIEASVATPAGGRTIVDAALDAFGTVDAVVNNAGIMRPGAFEDLDPDLLGAHLAVHAGGAFHVTQAAWPVMREKGYGRVVMISSASGAFGMHNNALYGTAKGAIHALGRCLALDGAEHGILVNIVLPNAATNMGKDNPVPGYERHFREELRTVLAPLRETVGVAPLVTFLASSACTLTGEAFSSTCGRVAQVFVGVTEGWVGDHAAMTAEEIQTSLEQIRDRSRMSVPASLWEEYEAIGRTLGVS